MPHAYVSVDVLKSTGAAKITSTAYDARIRGIIEAVSLEIDKYVARSIQPYVQTKYFSGDGSQLLIVPDLISVGTLSEDGNGGGTFSTVWASTDYFLIPYNAEPTSDQGARTYPYHGVEVNNKANGAQDVFLNGQRNYEIVGTWGYQYIVNDSGIGASIDNATAATSINVDGSVAGILEAGNTVLIGTQTAYLTSATGTNITVVRGVNGVTAGSIGSGDSISVFQYPEPVLEATLIQSMRLWKRREAAFASQIGFQDVGIVQTFRGLDQDVKLFLNPFKSLSIG